MAMLLQVLIDESSYPKLVEISHSRSYPNLECKVTLNCCCSEPTALLAAQYCQQQLPPKQLAHATAPSLLWLLTPVELNAVHSAQGQGHSPGLAKNTAICDNRGKARWYPGEPLAVDQQHRELEVC